VNKLLSVIESKIQYCIRKQHFQIIIFKCVFLFLNSVIFQTPYWIIEAVKSYLFTSQTFKKIFTRISEIPLTI